MSDKNNNTKQKNLIQLFKEELKQAKKEAYESCNIKYIINDKKALRR